MNKPAFTPGPWKWYPDELCQSELPYETILEKGCSGGYDSCGGYIQWGKNKEANANLIAAAPDMYEALILLKDAINDAEINSSPKDINNALFFAKRALAKAEGGTPND